MIYKVLTANRLSDGIAVWLSANGEWTTSLQGALLARHAEAEASLEAIGKRDFAANRILDVNLIEVEESGETIRPIRLRERIRAEGPSIEYGLKAVPAATAA